MEKMKKLYRSDKFPMYIYIIYIAIIHIFMVKRIDDTFFSSACENINLLEFIFQRYQTWTSRIIIEGILTIFCQYLPMFIWKIFNIGMYYLLISSISQLIIVKNKRKLNTIMCICLLAIPIDALKEAGWMATMNNYLWVGATGMYSLTLLKKIVNNQKINILQIVSYLLAIIYASNQEQMVGILFIIYTLFGVWYIIKKQKMKPIIIINYIIIILQLILVITCPGNMNRKIQEEAKWYPGFSELSIFEKLTNSVISMMDYVVDRGRILFFLLIILIAYIILKKYKNNQYQIIGCIPLILGVVLKFTIIVLKFAIIILNKTTYIQLIENSQIYIYAKLITYLLILIFIGLDIWIIFRDNRKMLINSILIYLIGFISRLVIAFSPTVYASGERTSLFWYISFVILIILIIKEDYKEKEIIKNGKIQKN